MKIKLDENLPAALIPALSKLGHDIDTVADEGLRGKLDPEVWASAQKAGRFLITQDLDFSDLRRYAPGTHNGLLLVRLHSPGRRSLFERIRMVFKAEQVETWAGCFVVISDHKIRIRRP